ncbi:MAG: hypothetical protein ACE3L7_07380 [Candidatus Pristimantibacillus sp.]
MIFTWWCQGLGVILLIGVVVVMFLNFYEVKVVTVTKEKLPNGNWTVSNAGKTISYLNYNTNRQKRQRRIS